MNSRLVGLFLILVLVASLVPAAFAQQLTADQSKRVYDLEHQFMAPCCYGETLYGHMSPAAQDMKTEIAQLVGAGKSNREIVEFYKAKFGERILTEPEGTQWWVMNVVPFVILALGLLATVLVIRRMYRPATPSAA